MDTLVLHTFFSQYLKERFDGDSNEVCQIIEIAENVIPDVLNDYFGTNYNSIYEIRDVNEVEEFRKKIKKDPILKAKDMSEEPRYTEVLKEYRLFLKALSSNSLPIPVPGEKESPDVEPDKQNVPVTPKRNLTTIFLEGEAGESQTKEYRQRNMALREACKDYFRNLHGGRLVCECCGFDFSAFYDINDEYIEIHHRFPFSQTDGEHPVDAVTDLVPLCANCHRMIHHGMGGRGNCMSLDDLKKKLR